MNKHLCYLSTEVHMYAKFDYLIVMVIYTIELSEIQSKTQYKISRHSV